MRKGKGWRRILEEFNNLSTSLKNPQGESRTFRENKMLILALRAALNRHVRVLNLNPEVTINWTCIENEVASDFFVSNKLVHDLRTGFFEDGDVWVLGQVGSRGMGATEKIHHQTKVEPDHLKQIAMFVDEKHSNGNAVVAR